jgi:hypothetical protein
MGRLTNTPTPVIEAVYALVKLLDEVRKANLELDVNERAIKAA